MTQTSPLAIPGDEQHLFLELADRLAVRLRSAALEVADARRSLRGTAGQERALEAIDRAAGELDRADKDLRNTVAAAALALAAPPPSGQPAASNGA